MIILKKGAMFGLDARIALAIFGSLSLISGAALYSAITESKATKTLAQFKEIAKAWDQYILDTGSYLPRSSSNDASSAYREIRIKELVTDNGVAGWDGPYINIEPHPAGSWQSLICPQTTGNDCLINMAEHAPGTSNNCRKYMSVCDIWIVKSIYFSSNKDLDMNEVNILDMKLDGGDGASSGDLQWSGSDIKYRVTTLKAAAF